MVVMIDEIERLWNTTSSDWTEKTLKDLTLALRREVHRFPEPGWLTFRTTALAAELLEQLGLVVHVGEEIIAREQVIDAPDEAQIAAQHQLCRSFLAGNGGAEVDAGIPSEKQNEKLCQYDKWKHRMGGLGGIVAIYDSHIPGQTVAYRFDMDSLELAESDACEHLPQKEGFASQCEGRFHACGHDGHVSMGLCLAKMLMEQKSAVKGKLMFIFQPAEEGVRGAKSYCKHWKYGKIDKLFCCHIGFAPEGTLVAGANGFLATTKLDVEFFGKSAHAGLCPERGRNALLAAADAMVQMQKIKPCAQKKITRLNVGSLQGGEARNTIPAHAVMKLETRGSDTELNQYMRTCAEDIIRQCADKYGVTYAISQKGESDSADSSEILSREILRIAETTNAFEQYVLHQDFGASDDGAVFMNMVKEGGGAAAYLLFGTAVAGKHHEREFDFDEEVMVKGCKVLFQCFLAEGVR